MSPGIARFLTSIPGACLLVLVLATLATLPVSFGAGGDSFVGVASVAGAAVFFFLAVPFYLIRNVLKEDPAAYGWRLPEHTRKAIALSAAVFVLHLPAIIYLSQLGSFQSFYAPAAEVLPGLTLFTLALSSAYYLAEEFLFRGFLFFALWKRYAAGAFVVNALLFGLLHFAKPPLEISFAMLSALLLCWLSLRTKSFLPAAAVHFTTALSLNLLI